METTAYEYNFNRYVEVIASELNCTMTKARELMHTGIGLNVSNDVEEIADHIILNHLTNI